MSKKFISRIAVAQRWDKHPTTVVRILHRFGVTGMKVGETAQSSRMYEIEDVLKVEKLAKLRARARSGNDVQ